MQTCYEIIDPNLYVQNVIEIKIVIEDHNFAEWICTIAECNHANAECIYAFEECS